MKHALAVEGVTHSYGRRVALSGVSLTVDEGSFTALLGINGAGKTTLFNLITRLFHAREGSIRVCGHDVRRDPRPALAAMGVVFQSRALDMGLSIDQNMVYQGALHGIGRREARARATALLEGIGLADRMGERVATLSGGQLRRVEIARALLHGPRLLLCDEATVGLDIASRTAMVEDLHRMARDEGVGILWATHLIDEIRPDDRVHVLHRGVVMASDGADRIAGEGSLADAFVALTGAGA